MKDLVYLEQMRFLPPTNLKIDGGRNDKWWFMSERQDFPKMEEKILDFWKEKDIFKKTLAKPAPRGRFVFFEGPPTANGKPGIHHVEARAYKDVIPRYRTMRGYKVDRKAGWDTHGLPVEIGVEKKLGISGKPQIESLKETPSQSIAYFNSLCKESVWEYLKEWISLTERIGFWLDLDNPYITYQNEYIESLWNIVKRIDERGLLERDYKVVPYCSRCGTPLSSHELAQGYDEAEDPSIYIKFKITRSPPSPTPPIKGGAASPSMGEDEGGGDQTYFLVWTTTPWTLPGNIALAVHPDLDYVRVRQKPPSPTPPIKGGAASPSMGEDEGGGDLILAKARLSILEGDYEIIKEYKGKDLLNLEYEPLYSFVKLDSRAHYVVPADFVSIEDGTGIVHIAPMYGVDDFELGKKFGLPMVHTVNLRGEFVPEVAPWAGIFVKDTDPKIIEELKSRGLMYRAETVRHTYPFCWRCDTPLLYYAKESWFVKISKLRDELLRRAETINWVPDYIKEGRFGEWLREVKDWAFSRERYWGTPLPVWICESCGDRKVVGSFEEFPLSKNFYWLIRHGEANQNKEGIVTVDPESKHHLTENGKEQIINAIVELKKSGGIDIIFASPISRTKETAEMIAKEFGLSVIFDDRIREIEFGIFEGKAISEYESFWSQPIEKFSRAPEGAETLSDVARRMNEFTKEVEEKHHGQKILIVSHGDPLWVFEGASRGLSPKGIIEFGQQSYIKKGELRKIDLRQLPMRVDGFVDPHRPFIDEVKFFCACGGTMSRTPEVIDVWFDSGSMPFAQWHYPFENKEKIDELEAYPADYISEAIDQTRGWFYTLLAVATLLEKDAPYRNVVCLGHIVDVEGKKMSKSVGNVVDPWEMINKYGADAVRMFMYTISQSGDTKRFDPNDLDRIVRQQFMILWNVLSFWKLYSTAKMDAAPHETEDKMDEWLVARKNLLIKEVTENLDAYELTNASRAIEEFIDEMSTWYVRRSRDRFKSNNRRSVAVLGDALLTVSKVLAPFAPFISESLYQELGNILGKKDFESIHLADWPEVGVLNEGLLSEMKLVRTAAELGHAIRAEKTIRVRQPLSILEISALNLKIKSSLLKILAEELNVKNVNIVPAIAEREGFIIKSDRGITMALNIEITPELRREGWLRELIRHINDLRKEAGLTISDRVNVYFETEDSEAAQVFDLFAGEIKKNTLSLEVKVGREGSGKDLKLGDKMVWVGIMKV